MFEQGNCFGFHEFEQSSTEAGLINWDREACWITKGPNFEAAAEILSFLNNESEILSLERATV
mgnify:CR=1 FL=1